MAQFGRDRNALNGLVAKAARYTFLCGLPMLLGLALLSGPLVRTLYGLQYVPVIPVLFWAAALAIPKTMLLPAQLLLQATEQQRFLVIWGCFCGAVNIGLDVLLIPAHGALGAAIGNGVGQALGVVGMWSRAAVLYRIELPWRDLLRIAACGCGMAAAVCGLTLISPAWLALVASTAGGFAAFAILLRVFKVVTLEDRGRIQRISSRAPRLLQLCTERIVVALSPAG